MRGKGVAEGGDFARGEERLPEDHRTGSFADTDEESD
jgi:hypothetical protein